MRQKQLTRVRLGPITKGVLGIVAVAGTVSILAVAPGLTVAMAPFLKKKKYQPRQAINKSIDSLVKRGLLKSFVDADGEVNITLTKRGRWEAGIRNLWGERSGKIKKWDGVWRVIVFDVPESKGHLRGELRRAVRLYGFRQLQKSVWVYPYPCDDFVQLIKQHLGISSDVLYMTVNYLENDKELRREFRL